MSYERDFQSHLIKTLKKLFPECIVIKNDANYIQGIPDLLVLNNDKWAALECKKDKKSSHRPNQEYWIEHMDNMSYAKFVYPENLEEVLDDLQQTFKP